MAIAGAAKFKNQNEEVKKGFLIADSRPQHRGKAALVLEDGTCFFGQGFGAVRKVSGEVVFSTSMVGYPEALTDPSYQGQILTLTYPLVGNCGVPSKITEFDIPLYFESDGIKVNGVVIHDLCDRPYHWASTKSLDAWLRDENIPGIFGIDTRRLTKKLRTKGVMLGVLEVCESGKEPDVEGLITQARGLMDPNLRDLVREVTVKEPVRHEAEGRKTVVLIDCGVRYSILRDLLKHRINVVRAPYDFSAREVLGYKPSGVIISNGPGNPKKCRKTVECVQELLEEDLPLLGICLGTQILALASGGDTYKLKYGHRSQNQPVIDVETGRCYTTTQNHGYAVDADSLRGKDLKVVFTNANDKTVEGLKHTKRRAFALQWHPTGDTEFLLDDFLRQMEG